MFRIPFPIPRLGPGFRIVDIGVILSVLSILYLIVFIASGWSGDIGSIEIDLSPSNLPYYALNSIFRIIVAYILSLIFAIWYGYTANKSRLNEQIMIPLLDILQSIPVLSFLPGVTLFMIALFPGSRIGLEISSIILIFTGQVWNIAFSYYNSINTLPKELGEVANIYRLSRFQRFARLELPFSAIGLVWNSMMSVAGGWFFLMACEMFILKDKDFRLPGLGSYIHTAADKGDISHVFYGLGTMVIIIIVLDIFMWRPLVAWTQKFRFDITAGEEERESLVLDLIRRSTVLEKIFNNLTRLSEKMDRLLEIEWKGSSWLRHLFKNAVRIFIIIILIWLLVKAAFFLSGLKIDALPSILKSTGFSLLRTTAAIILAAIWTIPLGVLIGMNIRAARILQPLIQIVASIPATALFPVIILILIRIGGGLDIGSIFLMLLGTQWYILFNVIAGASSIPQELREASKVYGLHGIRKWRVLILPGIFPYLITGFITATGGAWNATIVSEYVTFAGMTLTTPGLGSSISIATASGNFRMLLANTVAMAIAVVAINRLLWKRLFIMAQEKYRLE
ncbi:MAG: ABC transporter permease [Nitrospirae bacterium RIFCSPLOW2_12_42_9]|nr:MAG: ABC transporter permease [Nitrospirae bacterium RIFCSPLOW2_12_42_9]